VSQPVQEDAADLQAPAPQPRPTAGDRPADNGPLAALGRMRAPQVRRDIARHRPDDDARPDASNAFPAVMVPRKIEHQAKPILVHDFVIDRQVKLRRRAESTIHAPEQEYKRQTRKEKNEVLQAFHRYAAANPVSAPGAVSLKAWAGESSASSAAVRGATRGDDVAN
jgi:hypothetical protein